MKANERELMASYIRRAAERFEKKEGSLQLIIEARLLLEKLAYLIEGEKILSAEFKEILGEINCVRLKCAQGGINPLVLENCISLCAILGSITPWKERWVFFLAFVQ